MHQDSECPEETQCGVQKETVCVLHAQLARGNDAAKTVREGSLLDCQGEHSSVEVDSMKGEKGDKLVLFHLRLSE